ncbi:MAG: sigma-54 interaction domain-containing protein [Planctomycetota bacterium]|jgi:transcriptional regulator with PAS, ATPase and Fis domain
MTSAALEAFLGEIGPAEAFEVLSGLLPDAAVFVVDADRNVLHWSPGAEKVLGFPAEEAVGRLCLSSIRCRNCMLGCGIARLGHVDGVPLDLYRRDERWIPVEKYARAFFGADGEFLGGIEVLLPTGAPGESEGERDPETDAERFSPSADTETFHGLLSRDPVMRRAFQSIRNLAETDASVLLRGESGCGKELAARAIHHESHRRDAPFVAVNCAALTPSLVESELFGHVRGAFTGAVSERRGLFQQADGGTLFLDEVAELPLEMQGKLLRVLEQRQVAPLGGDREIAVDVRVIAATHRALREEVKAGRFREDLMYRLRVVPVFLPPLRERRGDVEVLLWHLLEEFNARGPRRVERVAPDAMRALLDHAWPGNVRELRNVVEYAFAVGRGPELRRDELPPELQEGAQERRAGAPTARVTRRDGDEKARIREALQLSEGRINEAADRLGMSRATFWRKRRKYDL